jgi:hypothetical protein
MKIILQQFESTLSILGIVHRLIRLQIFILDLDRSKSVRFRKFISKNRPATRPKRQLK